MQDCPALSKFSAHQIDGHHDNSDERLVNGVLGMIEVLERQRLTKDQRRIILTMRESAQALLHIIDDVLDFSKIEAGRLELEATPFSLSGLVEGALDTLRPQVLADRARPFHRPAARAGHGR